MMMVAKIIFIHIGVFAFLFSPLSAQAQGDPRAGSRGQVIESGVELIDLGAFTVEQTSNIEGSRYYINEWLPGEVVFIENITSDKLELKIDVFNDELHFLVDDNILAIDNKTIRTIKLDKDGEQIVFKTGYKDPSASIKAEDFLRVIYEGKEISLLADHNCEIRKSNTSVMYSGRVIHEFRHSTDHYLKTGSGKLIKLRKLKKKHILRALENKNSKLESVVKEKNLDWSDENDLKQILKIYEGFG